MRDHNKSLSLEVVARRALNIDGRGGLGGIIDADFIDQKGGAYTVLVASLSPYYKNGSQETRSEISDIITQFSYVKSDITSEEYFESVEEITNVLKQFLHKHQ